MANLLASSTPQRPTNRASRGSRGTSFPCIASEAAGSAVPSLRSHRKTAIGKMLRIEGGLGLQKVWKKREHHEASIFLGCCFLETLNTRNC